ncbi:hypothetical protein EsDP_00001283 [Epichloe bromicola]
MRRPRGPGGRFLTAEEVAAMEREAKGESGGKLDGGDSAPHKSIDPSGGKRKSEAEPGSPNKRSKTEAASFEGEGDES